MVGGWGRVWMMEVWSGFWLGSCLYFSSRWMRGYVGYYFCSSFLALFGGLLLFFLIISLVSEGRGWVFRSFSLGNVGGFLEVLTWEFRF